MRAELVPIVPSRDGTQSKLPRAMQKNIDGALKNMKNAAAGYHEDVTIDDRADSKRGGL